MFKSLVRSCGLPPNFVWENEMKAVGLFLFILGSWPDAPSFSQVDFVLCVLNVKSNKVTLFEDFLIHINQKKLYIAIKVPALLLLCKYWQQVISSIFDWSWMSTKD